MEHIQKSLDIKHDRMYMVTSNTTIDVTRIRRKPLAKKLSTLDGALQYAKLALETFPKIKIEIEPIDEPIYKYLVTIADI